MIMSDVSTSYHELCAWTLGLGDQEFVHQHVVDAHAVQSATTASKAIGVAFALIGLYLHLDRGFTGKQVQRAHMQLARRWREWPSFALPEHRGRMRAGDVIAAPPGPQRLAAIDAWCASVWEACGDLHAPVKELLRQRLR